VRGDLTVYYCNVNISAVLIENLDISVLLTVSLVLFHTLDYDRSLMLVVVGREERIFRNLLTVAMRLSKPR
jgi:hypothetical protein